MTNPTPSTPAQPQPQTTSRGFDLHDFHDLYGHSCSLQKSSLATEDAIWLGVNDPNPRILHGDAKRLGVETNATCGWVDYPLPDEVLCTTRMHLSQQQVKELLPFLQRFAESGSIYRHDPTHTPGAPVLPDDLVDQWRREWIQTPDFGQICSRRLPYACTLLDFTAKKAAAWGYAQAMQEFGEILTGLLPAAAEYARSLEDGSPEGMNAAAEIHSYVDRARAAAERLGGGGQ